ncbi:hypothetical protein [Bradyrhizobium sp. BWA-3-5]|uniref:hypothetical protein n=1 Tax=Bradyrhizobium sp. BWA-3-5 TaxID=3080013 RepID=UPI00293F48BA|nr:hypothetical protein [Bradyrhizobium sp. BWA-3-5]WOH64005.1 hypothetical protein RX331_25700 [Bradyrhizobium sp. BWA-3-5]
MHANLNVTLVKVYWMGGSMRTHSSLMYSGMLSNLCGLSCIMYPFSMWYASLINLRITIVVFDVENPEQLDFLVADVRGRELSKRSAASIGTIRLRPAKAFSTASQAFDLDRALRNIHGCLHRYSPEQPDRMAVGHIVMGTQ